jgi:hypothetical protein
MKLPWLRRKPFLSVVVVIYSMPDQAERTLRSLASGYQRGVREDDYEVVVVENRSDQLLGAARARATGGNVRYFLREEAQRTPVHAVNFGAGRARGSHIAIMIDGARMLSPGVLRLTLDALALSPHAAVATPGYHLGSVTQQQAVDAGYGAAEEALLLAGIAWPADGYRLFEIAAFSESGREGFLLPGPESNFLAMSRALWREIGGMDRRYDDNGGGYANHDLYKRTLEHPQTTCYLLFGEGSFHQYHGGITTGTPAAEREKVCAQIIAQDFRLRGDNRDHPARPPVFFGALHPASYRFLAHSLARAEAAVAREAQSSRQPQAEK